MQNILSFRSWVLVARPKTLIAGIAPVIVGALMSRSFDPLLFLCILLSSIFIQIGTNIANDYYDFFYNRDTEKRRGPTRASASGLLLPTSVKKGFIFSFFLSFAFALYPIYVGGPFIAWFGLLCILLGIYYTKGKYALSVTGLADLCVLLFFGLFASGLTNFLLDKSFSLIAFVAGLGPGFVSTAILCANNLRDREEDASVGKKTLVVRFGQTFGKIEYLLCLLSANVVLSIFSPYYFLFFSFACLSPLKVCFTQTAPKSLLEKTAKLLFLYLLLFSLGCLI